MAHKTGLEDYYVIKNQKKLHFGYTTGSCAAGAAKGATEMLVGRVTRPGLSQKVGEAAINPVPKAMILKAVEDAADRYHYEGGLKVTISVPEGEKIAKKTFNPRLGIQGGISILGTSGIVEPMSEKALIQSIQVEMKQHFCSNYVGETIDMAVNMGVKGILFISHIGKFVKVAAGIMNTHSHSADGRMEVLCAAAIRSGADLECAREILACNTTDEALHVLDRYHILQKAMEDVTRHIQFYLDHRSYQQILLGAVIFSNEFGYLGQTEHAEELIRKINSAESK